MTIFTHGLEQYEHDVRWLEGMMIFTEEILVGLVSRSENNHLHGLVGGTNTTKISEWRQVLCHKILW